MQTTKYRGWTSSIGCTSLKPYIHFTKGTTPATCQLQQCNPVQISINVPTSTDTNPTLGHFYGLGANIPGKDPTGFFEMCFITPPPPSPSSPSKPSSNQTAVLSVPHDETGAMRHTRLSHCYSPKLKALQVSPQGPSGLQLLMLILPRVSHGRGKINVPQRPKRVQ